MFEPSLPGTRPQPLPWVSATTPSTFSQASSAMPENACAIIFAVDAEQFTDVSTAM
jgi:hypothetical protein